jgi:2-methylisocitrate lyase-like PEP mutase family enzyme
MNRHGDDQTARAARFRELHAGPVLVLPNAWDGASAVLIEAVGAPAIATTSAAISWAAGERDGEGLDREQMTAAIARVARTVSVPVSADIEGGYGQEPDDVAETVRAIVAAGAVGINLEDSPGGDGRPLHSAAAQARRIAAARSAAAACGVDVFVNARTDVFLHGVGDPGGRLADVQERARAYADAGADGLFVPGVGELDVIETLAAGPLPLNVMAGPGAPTVAALARAGVTRVSVGSAIAQSAYGLAARAAQELLESGSYGLLADAVEYGELNRLLARP